MMIQKGIRDGKCHAIDRYTKANNKYMKNCNNIDWSYLIYLDANNFCEWVIFHKLPVNSFKRKKIL